MATLDDLQRRQALQRFLQSRQGGGPSLEMSPRLQQTGFNKYGQAESSVFNPASEMIKESSKSIPDAMAGINMINELFSTSENLIPASDTPRQALGNRIVRGVAASPIGELANMEESNPSKLWDSVSSGFGTMLARAFGEKGVVTNRDVTRILKMIPSKGETKEVREGKKKFIMNMIKRRVDVHNKLVRLIGPEFGETVELNFDE